MIRDGAKTRYTDEDKEGLVIRLHTPEEIEENKKKFAGKQWKRRIIIILLFLLFVFLTVHATNERLWFVLEGITMLTAIFGIWAEFVTIRGVREARSRHYVELRITEKMKVEEYSDIRSESISFESFYPVKAVDTTSLYECLYYLSRDEYNTSEPGQILKVNVLPKDLQITDEKNG